MKWNEAYDMWDWLLKFQDEQYSEVVMPTEVWSAFLQLNYRIPIWLSNADRD